HENLIPRPATGNTTPRCSSPPTTGPHHQWAPRTIAIGPASSNHILPQPDTQTRYPPSPEPAHGIWSNHDHEYEPRPSPPLPPRAATRRPSKYLSWGTLARDTRRDEDGQFGAAPRGEDPNGWPNSSHVRWAPRTFIEGTSSEERGRYFLGGFGCAVDRTAVVSHTAPRKRWKSVSNKEIGVVVLFPFSKESKVEMWEKEKGEGRREEAEAMAVGEWVEEEEEEREGVALRWERFLPRVPVRVLLVEGDDSTRQIIAALLRKCSYRGLFHLCSFLPLIL
ncbi:hypothetical protein BHM03_00036314, partial [Ensete ventricosum]